MDSFKLGCLWEKVEKGGVKVRGHTLGGEDVFYERGSSTVKNVPKFLEEDEVKPVRSKGFVGFKGADCSMEFLSYDVMELRVIYIEKGYVYVREWDGPGRVSEVSSI